MSRRSALLGSPVGRRPRQHAPPPLAEQIAAPRGAVDPAASSTARSRRRELGTWAAEARSMGNPSLAEQLAARSGAVDPVAGPMSRRGALHARAAEARSVDPWCGGGRDNVQPPPLADQLVAPCGGVDWMHASPSVPLCR